MNTPIFEPVREAFASLSTVREWLRADLHPMDRADGEKFLASVATGEDPADLFQGAIPYISFLSDAAKLHFLPKILEALQKHSSSIFEIGAQLDGETGARLAQSLTEEQKCAVRRFLDALLADDAYKAYLDEYTRFKKLFA